MRSLGTTNIFNSHKLLLILIVMLMGVGEAVGQRTYAIGTITGGLISKGLLSGSPYGINRDVSGTNTIKTAGTIIGLLGIPNPSQSNFYYLGTVNTGSSAISGIGSSTFLGENEINPAVLTANKTLNAVLLPVAGSSTFIQFRYPSPQTGTTYFKLKEKPIRTSSLNVELLRVLGLSASNIISGEVYNTSLQPQNYLGAIGLNAKIDQNQGTPLGNSNKPTITELLIDKHGEWFAAVTPTETGTYNSARLIAQFPDDINVLSSGNEVSTTVYNAYTEKGGVCNTRPTYTNEGIATGVTLDLGTVTDALALAQILKNPQYAIDDAPSTYSAMASGSVNVTALSTISQKFHFNHLTNINDAIHFHLGLKNSIINVDLANLNGITFNFYNSISGSKHVIGLGDLSTFLGIKLGDLLNIETDIKDFDFYYAPPQQFDRVEVIFDKGLLGIGLVSDALRIYDVSLAPASLPIITTQPNSINASNICEGSLASFTVASNTLAIPITNYIWQYYNGTSWVTVPNATNSSTYQISNTTLDMNNRKFRVKLIGGTSACQDVVSNEATLTIRPRATATDINVTDQTICSGLSTKLTASSTITNPSFKWYNNPELDGSPLSTTPDLTVSPNTTTAYYVTVENEDKCQNVPNSAKKVIVTVSPRPTSPHIISQ